jgi:arylsulfatase A-like enzyme
VPLPADGAPTLAERLAGAGYHTLGVTAAGVVSRAQGLSRGFDDWTELARVNFRSVMPEVLDAVTSARNRQPERPLFLFLHTYDIHGPYEVPRDHRSRPRSLPTKTEDERSWWRRQQALGHHRYLDLARYQGTGQVIDAYDAGIRFVDAQLALFFEVLEAQGWLDDSLVIVTSDHGEAFFEHGLYIGHSYSLFDSELRVPLIVRSPGQKQAQRSAELVDLTDLVPLVLDTVGLPVPEGLPGSNPLARAAGALPTRKTVRAESAHSGSSTIRSLTWKVVSAPMAFGDPRMRVSDDLASTFASGRLVFDLASDPREMRNLAATELSEEPRRLLHLVDELDAPGRRSAEFSLEDTEGLDESFLEQLRALGYLEESK